MCRSWIRQQDTSRRVNPRAQWPGLHDPPVTTRTGASSLVGVSIRTRAGTITIS
jgi:hypothetical protein